MHGQVVILHKYNIALLNTLQVEQDMYEHKKLKIKNNPGFITEITLDKFKKDIEITVSNINNINYLLRIPIYLDAIIKLTQGIGNGVNISKDEINKKCKPSSTKKSKKNVDEKSDDIQAKIKPTFLQYNNNVDDFLNILDDDNNDDNDNDDNHE